MTTTATDSTVTHWSIDPAHTEVGFAVRHLMISTVRGRFGAVSGTVTIGGASPASSRVDVQIDASTIDTRSDQRDAHLRSADFFDVERFPSIAFRSTAVESTPTGFAVTGELTIRDVTRTVSFDAVDEGRGTDPWGNGKAAFSTRLTIDRRDFGLTWNQALETGGMLVSNDVVITLDVQLNLAREE